MRELRESANVVGVTTTTRTLNIREAVNLGIALSWTQRNARLQWVDDRGNLGEGIARCVGDMNGNFAGPDDDVRDCYMRITTTGGFEWFVPMSDVLDRIVAGTMVEDMR